MKTFVVALVTLKPFSALFSLWKNTHKFSMSSKALQHWFLCIPQPLLKQTRLRVPVQPILQDIGKCSHCRSSLCDSKDPFIISRAKVLHSDLQRPVYGMFLPYVEDPFLVQWEVKKLVQTRAGIWKWQALWKSSKVVLNHLNLCLYGKIHLGSNNVRGSMASGGSQFVQISQKNITFEIARAHCKFALIHTPFSTLWKALQIRG